ncbi:MAG: alanine:cation symporter family protein [Clostridia bacterium]|nr:alanine:cation symporter family protein [Clostridia bacterium]
MNILTTLNKLIFSPVMFAMLFICGGVLLIRLRGFPLTSPVKVTKSLMGKNLLSSFKAMTVALAGTLGVGNIVGVATAIHMGGAGAVFWMLVSAFAAMVIKYAEIYLAILYRRGHHGGAAYYIRDGMGRPGLAAVFSVLCIIASFTVGNMIQVNAVAQSFESEFSCNGLVVGSVIAILCFLVVYKGIGSISSFTLRMIPILSVGFILFSLVIIIANRSLIPGIIKEIFASAFKKSSAFGGVLGYLLSDSVRYGVVRGIGSNEAGCGTAPTAHATAEATSPRKQGCFGIFEVFVDTVLLCTLTALVILIYPLNIKEYDGIVLAVKAYESYFGEAAGYILSGAIFFFALSTVICWSYYAFEAIHYFTKREIYKKAYLVVYCLCCVMGAVLSLEFVWELSDITIALMTILNCTAVISLKNKIKC